MSRVVSDIAVTMDSCASGVGQTLETLFDEPYAAESAAEVAAIVDAGAFVMGRNMFSPDQGGWDLTWRGGWGDDGVSAQYWEQISVRPTTLVTHLVYRPVR
jgi:hypothetical protein